MTNQMSQNLSWFSQPNVSNHLTTDIVTKKRDREAALRLLKKAMKRFGHPKAIVTDRLRSYRAAMKIIGNAERQETGR